MLAELKRLEEARDRKANWKRWGPYLSERQWGTVREDYSENGDSWGYLPHDHARSRAYRWGEDGLLGITDRECRLCFALALWNGKDPILKERLFGLTGPEGNHGEDVKECYYYLDSTPTHSYMKALYKYPQAEFPYARLREENQRRSKSEREFELPDTGVFDEGRYFDVFAEYAKASPDDMLIRITAINRGPEKARLHLLPTLWFRNTWIWGCHHEGCTVKPRMDLAGDGRITTDHPTLGRFRFEADAADSGTSPQPLFTENESDSKLLWGIDNYTPYTKNAFHEYVIKGRKNAIDPKNRGTKASFLYVLDLEPGESASVRLRLRPEEESKAEAFGVNFERMLAGRMAEADEFYAARLPGGETQDEQNILRQSYAGLLWSKQFYHYVVKEWLEGDPDQPPPPEARKEGRNADWCHLFNRDIISMPDKWEYPWYAAWDLAFHMIPFSRIDPDFAKEQLLLLLREWYMHPSGQIPAYEFNFGDVNPPVHAWACWRVYKMSAPRGSRDTLFLKRCFQKLLLNFTWWVNRKDPNGCHVFAGGFLGLDNIGVFDRSKPLPTGGALEQADGTAWMAFYCMTMLQIALELAREVPSYEDLASKFFEHFVAIIDAMNTLAGTGLWDEEDGFYYDQIRMGEKTIRLKTRSLVGLLPLIAVGAIEDSTIAAMPGFKKRMDWFLENRPDLARHITTLESADGKRRLLLAITSRDRLVRVLRYMLDEDEFLSAYGIRSVSRVHKEQPYVFSMDGGSQRVDYVPGESDSSLFGGNSNWRGPIWFPVNFLLIEALERFHYFYGDGLEVECPSGSGNQMTLKCAAEEIEKRLTRIFVRDENAHRAVHDGEKRYAGDPDWRDLVLFYEYFHGDTGRGLGASHQTGWTALVSACIEDQIRIRGREFAPLARRAMESSPFAAGTPSRKTRRSAG